MVHWKNDQQPDGEMQMNKFILIAVATMALSACGHKNPTDRFAGMTPTERDIAIQKEVFGQHIDLPKPGTHVLINKF